MPVLLVNGRDDFRRPSRAQRRFLELMAPGRAQAARHARRRARAHRPASLVREPGLADKYLGRALNGVNHPGCGRQRSPPAPPARRVSSGGLRSAVTSRGSHGVTRPKSNQGPSGPAAATSRTKKTSTLKRISTDRRTSGTTQRGGRAIVETENTTTCRRPGSTPRRSPQSDTCSSNIRRKPAHHREAEQVEGEHVERARCGGHGSPPVLRITPGRSEAASTSNSGGAPSSGRSTRRRATREPGSGASWIPAPRRSRPGRSTISRLSRSRTAKRPAPATGRRSGRRRPRRRPSSESALGNPIASRSSAVHSTWLVVDGTPRWSRRRRGSPPCAKRRRGRTSLTASKPPRSMKLSTRIAAHLAARDLVLRVGVEAGIEDGSNGGAPQPPRDTERALVLLPDAQVKRLHAADQQVGRHRSSAAPVISR